MDLLSYELGKKASGGGGSGSLQPVWYGADLAGDETSGYFSLSVNFRTKFDSTYPQQIRTLKKGLVVAFVRSDYTISENVTVLGESDYITAGDGTKQKIIVGWCDDFTQNITLTQQIGGRMALYGLRMQYCEVPTSSDIIINTTTTSSSITANSTSDLCVYFATTIYSNAYSGIDNLDDFYNPGSIFGGERLVYFTTYKAGEVTIPTDSRGTALIGVKIKGSSTR